jgi:hypothetical protein
MPVDGRLPAGDFGSGFGQADFPFLRDLAGAVDNGHMPDGIHVGGSAFRENFPDQGILDLFFLEIVEFDFDQFVGVQGFFNGSHERRGDPLLANEHKRLEVVGKSAKIVFLETLKNKHVRLHKINGKKRNFRAIPEARGIFS